MRLRGTLLTMVAVTVGCLGALTLTSPAGAATPVGLQVTVDTSPASAPTVVLTNKGSAPCQVVATAVGTIALADVEQGGKRIEPTAIFPSYTDDLGYLLAKQLKTLAPGQSVTLALTVVPTGATGHALQTVSWSALATIGAQYPIDPTRALSLVASYQSPIAVTEGAPLCIAGASGSAADSGRPGWVIWVVLAVGLAGLVAVGVIVLVILSRRRHRRAAAGAALALALIAGLLSAGWGARPASATISGDAGVAAALAGCMTSFSAPGGDPRNILPTLQDPNVHVTVNLDTGGANGENRFDPRNIFVYWSPDDTRPFHDGVARKPCDELYHELYHAFEDTMPQGVDSHECITAGGVHSGISIKEVHATQAENARRAAQGRQQRGYYGDNKLPTGDCLPPDKDTPLCHPTYGCPKPPAKPPASTHSDPHLTTFDGRRFDFQGAGEFVAAHDGDFQIQVRETPWPNSRTVATNTAVAANVAADRVEVRLLNGHLNLLVNGAATALGSASLPKGGKLVLGTYKHADLLAVDWPDGSYLLVTTFGTTSLTLLVSAAPGHAGKLTGLLGNDNDDPADDLRVGAGAPITEANHDSLYPKYADSLRINQSGSLFSYDAGASTATYTDRSFPDKAPDPLPSAGWAKAVCQQYGITDPVSLAECLLDVASTGSAEFVGSAVVAQSTSVGLRVGGAGTSLAVGTPGGTVSVTFAGTAGQKLYVDVPETTLPSGCGILSLRDPAGKTLATGCLINGKGGIDTVTLPVDGTYTVLVDPPDNATGTITLRLISATDQQSTLAVDGVEQTVSVTTAGGVGKVTFTANGGTVVYVDVLSSTLPSECGVLSLHDPADKVLETGCLVNGTGSIGRTELTGTGRYTIVVDPSGTGTGEVHLKVTQAIDQRGTIGVDGPAVAAKISQPGALARFTFTGSAGQVIYLDASNSTLKGQCGVLALIDPTGNRLNTGCLVNGVGSIDRTVLTGSGTYTVTVDPADADTGQVTVRLFGATDQTGTIILGGPTVAATVGQPGALARFTFTGSAGQRVVLDVPSADLPSGCGVLILADSAGQQLATGCIINGTGSIDAFTLPAAGTYTIIVDPSGNQTGHATLRLHS